MVATLDGKRLPFNPNTVRWGYRLNTSSFDTLSGRVLQLLSVNIQTIQWEADAGSRDGLYRVAEIVEGVMEKHADTKESVRLIVPRKNWSFDVFVSSLPNVGYDPQTVTFPYSMQAEVDQDFSDISGAVMNDLLRRLASGIGFNPENYGDISNEYLERMESRGGGGGPAYVVR